MRYMLMMHAPGGTGEYQVSDWAPQDLKAHIDFMVRLNRELTAKGELVAAEGLAPPGQARVVRAAKDGAPAVTDGPFPEAKEQLGGFWIIKAPDLDAALGWARQATVACKGPVEVRPLQDEPEG